MTAGDVAREVLRQADFWLQDAREAVDAYDVDSPAYYRALERRECALALVKLMAELEGPRP